MAKPKPKAWYRTSEDAWYIRLGGKLFRLAKGRANLAEAESALRRLLLKHGISPDEGLTIDNLADAYLHRPEAHTHAPNTQRISTAFVRSFVTMFGTMPVADLRKSHLQAWLDCYPDWADSTAWTAATRILSMLNWAVKEEALPYHRLKGFRKPSVVSRGSEAIVNEATHQQILTKAKSKGLVSVLSVLRETGMRPSELCQLEAKDFEEKQNLFRIGNHKNKRKGKQRFVLLSLYFPQQSPGQAAI